MHSNNPCVFSFFYIRTMPLTRGVQLTTNTFRISREIAPSVSTPPLLLLLKAKGRLAPAAAEA
jgi:hypothetical protein